MTSKSRPRLGRGLSALLGQPVSVEPPAGHDNVASAAPATGDRDDAAPQLQLIRVSEIGPSRFQPRQVMDEAALERLAASIRVSGVIQPVAVRPASVAGERRWELVAGERRWRAASRAGLELIPAVVVSLDDRESAEWGLIENVQREDLNAIERGWALRRMVEHFELAHDAVAERVGLERSSVTNFIRLTELETSIQDLIARDKLSAGHGKALLALPPGPGRVDAAKRAAAHQWSVRKLEELARGEKKGVAAAPAEKRSVGVADLERRLGAHLGTKVRILPDRSGIRGRLVISFYDLDQFDGVLAKIGLGAG
jgi:ParB family chromosome partitioning protein